ncbi:MAG: hypothetical protein ACYTGQ_11160 [Planctomycetota bacterium]|jgi:hypothetical protein
MTLYIVLGYLLASYFVGVCILMSVRSKVKTTAESQTQAEILTAEIPEIPEVAGTEEAEPLTPKITVGSTLRQSA